MLIGASGSWHAAGSQAGACHWSSLNPRQCWVGTGRAGRPNWRWRSRARGDRGRRPIGCELRSLIRRMALENHRWSQRRIQAELARLGFTVSARTVAKYMRWAHVAGPSSGWRGFLRRHATDTWACNFFCVQTLWFQTLYAFFVIHHARREVVHIRVTRHPRAEWAAQQILECSGWDREPPRFLIHDRDSRFGALYDQRLRNPGISQVRTPFRAPRANLIAERWVRSFRRECLDYTPVVSEGHLRRVLAELVAYFN
jgi:putative transposase